MDKSTKELLAQAEKLCAQRNVRLTPQRLEVLRLMSLQQGAISAYDLLDLLRESEPQAKPPTVYRALDFLVEQGILHRVDALNGYVVCQHLDDAQHHEHANVIVTCRDCGRVDEMLADAGVQALRQSCLAQGFEMDNQQLLLNGHCTECLAKKGQA